MANVAPQPIRDSDIKRKLVAYYLLGHSFRECQARFNIPASTARRLFISAGGTPRVQGQENRLQQRIVINGEDYKWLRRHGRKSADLMRNALRDYMGKYDPDAILGEENTQSVSVKVPVEIDNFLKAHRDKRQFTLQAMAQYVEINSR